MSESELYGQLTDLGSSMEKFAYRLTKKREDAKDLVQETCLKVLICQTQYSTDENFKAWIFTIMKNTFINDYRRRFRQKTISEHLDENSAVSQIISPADDNPDASYNAKEMILYIEKLKDEFRIPFLLYLQGFKYKEIADKLNLKIGTVKSRIFLSRKCLMAIINK